MMTEQKCAELKQEFMQFLQSQVDTYLARGGACAIRLPFLDNVGDPIHIAVYDDGDSLRIEDTGTIAGHLFTLGQHTLNTPAFRLLKEIAQAYDLTLDFDNGAVTTKANAESAVQRVMDMTKAIITMVTATPFIRVSPHRVKSAGQRLRTRIKRAYKDANILDLVQDQYELPGESGIDWPIDFHWWLQAEHLTPIHNNGRQHIYVVAADFNVQDPLIKANHVAALGLDAKRNSRRDDLRVVVDRSRKDSEAREAISLLRMHSEKLGIKIYDFDSPDEHDAFIHQSTREILEDAGSAWRDFWLETSGLTFGSQH